MEAELTYWLPIGVAAASACALTLHSAWHRKGKGRYLCDDCRFNNEAACLKAERPKAVLCTSYRTVDENAR